MKLCKTFSCYLDTLLTMTESGKCAWYIAGSPSAEMNGVLCEANYNAAMISALVAKSFTDHTFFSALEVVVGRPVGVEGTSEEAGFSFFTQKFSRTAPDFTAVVTSV